MVFVTGSYVEPPLFTHKHYWQPLQVFLSHVDRVSERCWRVILEHGSDADADKDLYIDQSMLSACREDLYIRKALRIVFRQGSRI